MRKLHEAGLEPCYSTRWSRKLDLKGALHVLRHGFKFYGKTFLMAYFRPAHGLNDEVLTLYGKNKLTLTRQVSCHDLSTVVKLIERIRKYDEVPNRYKSRLRPRFDRVAGIKYVDSRALLTVRLLRRAKAARVARWVSDWKASTLADSLSPFR